MAYDEDLARRIREQVEVATGSPSAEMKMFGGLAFLVGGHMAVAAGSHGGLMVRVDPADSEELLTRPGVEPMVMRGRPMSGWLLVSREATTADDDLERWVRTGTAYAGSLPPK